MKHVLSVLVYNHAGVLSHVSGLFTRRGYNIDSLSVGVTQDPEKSVITIVVSEDEAMVRQIEQQLYKLVGVIAIEDLTYSDSLKRELLLVTVKSTIETRQELLTLVDVFDGRVTDMTETRIMVELAGKPRRVTTFIKALENYGIVKMARTGTIALAFPDEHSRDEDE